MPPVNSEHPWWFEPWLCTTYGSALLRARLIVAAMMFAAFLLLVLTGHGAESVLGLVVAVGLGAAEVSRRFTGPIPMPFLPGPATA